MIASFERGANVAMTFFEAPETMRTVPLTALSFVSDGWPLHALLQLHGYVKCCPKAGLIDRRPQYVIEIEWLIMTFHIMSNKGFFACLSPVPCVSLEAEQKVNIKLYHLDNKPGTQNTLHNAQRR